MSSIIGTKVKGNLGRPNTDFEGTVTAEYSVETGPLTGTPMAIVETTEGRTVYPFRAYLRPLTSDTTVSPTAFSHMSNVSVDGKQIGHIIFSTGSETYNVYRQLDEEDEWLGGAWTQEEAVKILTRHYRLSEVIRAYKGAVTAIEQDDTHTYLNVCFPNVIEKTQFAYAMRTAWKDVDRENRGPLNIGLAYLTAA